MSGALRAAVAAPWLGVAVDLGWYLLGAAALVLVLRAWRPELRWRHGAGYAAVVAAFLSPALLTPAHQIASDLVYRVGPWSEMGVGRVTPSNPLLADPLLQMLPFRTLVRQRWLSFQAPLWAHELGTGEPLLGNAQSAPLAPLHLLALPLPPLRAVTVAVAWQLLLAMLLMHLLLTRLGAGGTGAACGAVAFAFSGYLVVWAYYPLGMAAAWLPGVALGLIGSRYGDRGAAVGLVACATGLALSGHPETLAHAALGGGALVVGLACVPGAVGRGLFLLRAAGAAALAFCLAAPALLPVLDNLPASERRAILEGSEDAVQPASFDARLLAFAVDPFRFGSPRDGDWNGPANFNETAGVYAGLTAVVLATAGALSLGWRRAVLYVGGLLALSAALRWGPAFDLLRSIPGLGLAAHGRLRLLWVATVAVGAGLAVDRLRDHRRLRRLAAAALAGGIALLAALPPVAAGGWQRLWWGGTLLAAATLCVALLVPRLVRHAPAVALAALLVDLFLFGGRYNPAVPPRFDLRPPASVVWLQEAMAGADEPFRVVAEGWDFLADLPALYGLWDPRGNDPMRPAAAARFVGRRLAGPGYTVGMPVLQAAGRTDPGADAYLRIRYRLMPGRRPLPDPWRVAATTAGGQAWENPAVLPLFFLPRRLERVGSQEEAMARALAIEDFAAEAVVDGRGEAPPAGRGTVAARPVANGFALVAESPDGGLAASSVSYAPGWEAVTEGLRLPVRRVNGAFLGLELPAGRHLVSLRYRPRGWRWGWVLAGAAAAAALAAQLLRRRRVHLPAG